MHALDEAPRRAAVASPARSPRPIESSRADASQRSSRADAPRAPIARRCCEPPESDQALTAAELAAALKVDRNTHWMAALSLIGGLSRPRPAYRPRETRWRCRPTACVRACVSLACG